MNKITPILKVIDIKESIKFYKQFNFHTVVERPNSYKPEYARIYNNGVEIILQSESRIDADYPMMKDKLPSGTFALYIDVDDVKSIYELCKQNEIKIVKDMYITSFGQQEFSILDNNGYILVFAKALR